MIDSLWPTEISRVMQCKYCDVPFRDESHRKRHSNSSYCVGYRQTIFLCQGCGYFTRSHRDIDLHNASCKVDECDWKRVEDIIKCVPVSEETAVESNELAERVRKLESTVSDILNNLQLNKNNHLKSTELIDNSNELKVEDDEDGEEVPEPTEVVTRKNKKKVFRSMKKVMDVVDEEPPQEREERVEKTSAELEKRRWEIQGACPTEKDFEEIFEAMENSTAVSSKLMRALVEIRMKLVAYLPPDEYEKKVREQLERVISILKSKGWSKGRLNSGIIKTLGSIDSHIVGLPLGKNGYPSIKMEVDDFNAYREALALSVVHPTEFKVFDEHNFLQSLLNYGLALLPVEELIAKRLENPYGFPSIAYIEVPKSDPKDPFSFYTLAGIDATGKRRWEIDCRLTTLANRIQSAMYRHIVDLFRRIYFDSFGDNRYRPNFEDAFPIMEFEGDQLLRNVLTLHNVRTFSIILQGIVQSCCKHTITDLDSCNIRTDDASQRRRMHCDKDDPDMADAIRILFDDVTSAQAVDLYRRKMSEK